MRSIVILPIGRHDKRQSCAGKTSLVRPSALLARYDVIGEGSAGAPPAIASRGGALATYGDEREGTRRERGTR